MLNDTFMIMMKSTKITFQHIMLLVAIGLAVANLMLVSGQNINVRSNGEASDKPSDGGQPRPIYQKPLLTHRMMHFGKRQPLSPRYNYDLASSERFGNLASQQLEAFPYSLAFIMDRDSKNLNRYYTDMPSSDMTDFVRFAPNEIQNDADLFLPNSNRYYYPQPTNNGLVKQTNQRLMINSEQQQPSSSTNNNESEGNNQQSDSAFINVHTRSMANNGDNLNSIAAGQRGPAFNLPRSFISTLYGRQANTGVPGVGGYNKKAEPKDNFFMHFG